MKCNLKCLFLFAVGIVELSSCTQDDASTVEIVQSLQPTDMHISSSITRLQESDALKVAVSFARTNDVHSRSNHSHCSVTPVYANNGTLVMYAVNYPNDGGFTLISASKNYAPVLAFSDEGSLNDSILQNNSFINEYKEYIEEVIELDSDSLRKNYAFAWLPYEDASANILSSRVAREWSDAEIAALRSQAVQNYEAQGFTCLPLAHALDIIQPTPSEPNRAQNFVNQVCEQTAPGYDPYIVDIFAIKNIETTYGPLLQTQWHQHAPFYGGARNYKAGCWIIAMAQVMYYHKHPATYDWTSIPTNVYSYNAELDRLIRDLQVQSHANDSIDSQGTPVKTNDAVAAMQYFDYNIQKYDYPGVTQRNLLESSIIGNFPVFMTGYSDSVGHAWVCDGYRYTQTQYTAGYLTRLGMYRLQTGIYDDKLKYYHMNWGWKYASGNGWFYNDNVNVSIYNFNTRRHIFITSPNHN